MPRIGDRVKETSTSTGASNFTLAGAVTGFVTFNTDFGTYATFEYVIDGGSEWETGVGYLSDATTLVRDTVRGSSNSNNIVTFSAGTKTVFCDAIDEYLERPNRGRLLQIAKANFAF
jgi:hypothetical protein